VIGSLVTCRELKQLAMLACGFSREHSTRSLRRFELDNRREAREIGHVERQ
jgi:hypothetical protein